MAYGHLCTKIHYNQNAADKGVMWLAMGDSIKLAGAKVLSFLVFSCATVFLFPFLFTSETYSASDNVNPYFPIVINGENGPEVVVWGEYEKDVSSYVGKVRTAGSLEDSILPSADRLSFSTRGDKFRADLLTDSYRFWSTYSVKDGVVIPATFRFNGVFSIFYAVLVGILAAWFSARAVKSHITSRSTRLPGSSSR